VADFFDDLKSAYLLTGKQGKQVTLLVTEYSLKDELIMEYINNILLGQIVRIFYSSCCSFLYKWIFNRSICVILAYLQVLVQIETSPD
jgi:hypothetical protein